MRESELLTGMHKCTREGSVISYECVEQANFLACYVKKKNIWAQYTTANVINRNCQFYVEKQDILIFQYFSDDAVFVKVNGLSAPSF